MIARRPQHGLLLAACVLPMLLGSCRSLPLGPRNEPIVETTPAPGPYESLGVNLLRNPTFDAGLVDWRVPLGASWAVEGGPDGSGALVIRGRRWDDDPPYIRVTEVTQCVELVPAERFELRARYRHDVPPEETYGNRINVVWYDTLDCRKGGQHGGYIEGKPRLGWQQLSSNHLRPALGARAAKISITQRPRFTDGGVAVWDDLGFWAVEVFERSDAVPQDAPSAFFTREPGENHLSNGDFARDLEGWSPSSRAAWTGETGRAEPGAVKATVSSDQGGLGTGVLDQCVNFGESRRFEMAASVLRDPRSTQNGGGRLRVSWYAGNDCQGGVKTDTKHADPDESDGWQALRVEGLEPPHAARSAKIQLIQSVLGNGSFTMYWDDVRFVAVEEPAAPAR